MNFRDLGLVLLALTTTCGLGTVAHAADPSFDAALRGVQHEWAAANYSTGTRDERRAAFDALVARAAALAEQYPAEVEAIAWDGIVLSTYAGVVSKLSAMRYAKAARDRLHQAEAMNSEALSGGIYASLGALYSQVPGGLLGFGDDELAEAYFRKALEIDPSNLDTNYFYGEFLLDQDRAREALTYLARALEAPTVEDRPTFDAGRRAEARALIALANDELS